MLSRNLVLFIVILISIYATLGLHIDTKLRFLQQLSSKYIRWIIIISFSFLVGIIFTQISYYYASLQSDLVISLGEDFRISLSKFLVSTIFEGIGLGIALGILGSFLISSDTDEKRKTENKTK